MSLYQKASLVQIPSGYKAADAKLYSVVPNSGDGDFTVSSDADATRVNKDGLIETTVANQARLNYDPTNPQDPHLLLEPTRTNYALNSNDASQWTNVGGSQSITKTANFSTAPDGSNEATRLQASVTGSQYALISRSTTSITGNYSASVYVKSNTGSSQNISFYGRNSSTSAISVGTEWQRIEFQGSGTSGQNLYFNVGTHAGLGGDDNIDILVWGGQLEAGTYATSLIPTAGSAVTRTADDSHLLNQTLITDYPFTAYANAKIDAVGNTIFSLNNTSSQNYYLAFYFGSSTQVSVGRGTLSANDFDNYNFSYSVGDTIKVAVAFISATAYKLYINGTEIADVTSGTSIPFNHDDISLGQFRITGDTGTRNSVNEFMVFNEALTDAELQTLTT